MPSLMACEKGANPRQGIEKLSLLPFLEDNSVSIRKELILVRGLKWVLTDIADDFTFYLSETS